jgi:DNA replication regulator SLD2
MTAAKYREYDKLRRPTTKKTESQQINPAKPNHATPRKAAPTATPQKPTSQFLIPNIPSLQEEEAELEPTPAAVRMHLGPTPQKDGHILSLFDDLSSTASKPSRTALASIEANANFTPSKPSQLLFAENDSPPESVHDRTPASSSKRFLLDSFVSTTPLKRKREDEEPAHATPSSSKGLSTPAFLRRTSNMLIMNTLVEEAESDHEIKSLNFGRMRQPPFKKRGIVRSLSSIIQGLRKQEDDKLDEELEMMREMEDADDDHESAKPTVQVQDSQVVMPLGPDKGIESEESEEEERDTGVFRKPWKKKGLKRQTKRVISKSNLDQRDTLNHTNHPQCDLHQSPKLQLKLISLIQPLTTREMLPKHKSLTHWTISTQMQIQMQHTATRKQSGNDNSPRLLL